MLRPCPPVASKSGRGTRRTANVRTEAGYQIPWGYYGGPDECQETKLKPADKICPNCFTQEMLPSY